MIWLQRKGPVSQYDQTESDSFGSMESNIHPKRIIINQPDWKIVISQGNDDCIHHNILSFWGSLPLPELPFQPLVPPRTTQGAQLSRLLNSASNWSLNYPQMFVSSSISLRKNGWNILFKCRLSGYDDDNEETVEMRRHHQCEVLIAQLQSIVDILQRAFHIVRGHLSCHQCHHRF